MEQQLALFLFKYKSCSLPGIGTLKVLKHPATYIGSTQQIEPPVPYISFSEIENGISIAEYLAERNAISLSSANIQVEAFCQRLKDLKEQNKIEIPAAGWFTVDVSGKLQFNACTLPGEMLPVVDAKTVSRVADHSILVGDKESNATRMAAYYSAVEKKSFEAWKIWAIVLFLIATAAIAYNYFYLHNKGTGNSQKFEVRESAPTYKASEP